jgi:hypothetical protein
MKEKELPRLRSLSNMTEEEQKEWSAMAMERLRIGASLMGMSICNAKEDAWCKAHGLDNKGLIRQGLAIEIQTKEE